MASVSQRTTKQIKGLGHPQDEVAEICLACCASRFRLWFTKASSADSRLYPIFKCAGCKSAFVIPRPPGSYLEEYYSMDRSPLVTPILAIPEDARYEKILEEEREFPNSSVDAERMSSVCRSLAEGKRFLDVGAGYGFYSRAAQDRGFRVTALEPSLASRSIIRRMTGLDALPMMLNEEFVASNAQMFDVVLLSQVLEHIVDLDSTVRWIKRLMSPSGVVAIAVPHLGSLLSKLQGRNDMFITPPEHLNYFSYAGLEALFARHGLTCCHAHTISRVNLTRVQRRIHVRQLSKPISLMVKWALQFSDAFRGGMFLNLYFRHRQSPEPGS